MIKKTLETYYKDGWLIKQTHPTMPLTIWNYSNITQYNRKWDEITLKCRGLVTDQFGTVISRPFEKFFNIEENEHTETKTFEVFEKMDGSLITVFYYKEKWIVASRGSFTSEQAKAAQSLFDELDSSTLIPGYTYIFEYIADWNRIVVDYKGQEKIVMLGAINILSGEEICYKGLQIAANLLNCEVVKRYPSTDISKLKDTIGNNQEGYVVKFTNGSRMKIKGLEYIRLHRIMTEVSTTSIWKYLSTGGDLENLLTDVPDEFYNKIKSYEEFIEKQFTTVDNSCRSIMNEIMQHEPETQKSFAILVQTYPTKYHGLLYKMNNKADYSGLIWKLIKPKFIKL